VNPFVALVAMEMFDAHFVLRDKNIIAQRFDLFVAIELFAFVVIGGRSRQDFDDDNRIE